MKWCSVKINSALKWCYIEFKWGWCSKQIKWRSGSKDTASGPVASQPIFSIALALRKDFLEWK